MQHWKSCGLFLALVMQISSLSAAEPGQWIWSNEASDRVYFKKAFDLTKEVKDATLIGSADNELTVFVNGKQVLTSKEWERPQQANIKSVLKQGTNLIAVDGGNHGGIAALTCRSIFALLMAHRSEWLPMAVGKQA